MNWKSIRNPITYEQVKSTLASLEIDLPDSYCRIIGPINGGALASGVCLVPKIGEVPYSRNISLNPDSKVNAIVLYEQYKDKRIFPFGSVGNGDYFCFDLKNNSIILYQHENDAIISVCNSFEEFLALLDEKTK